MQLKLLALLFLSIAELLIWVKPFWKVRKYLASAVLVSQSVVIGLIFGSDYSFWTLMLLIFSGYRVLNLLRLVEGRTKSDYLYRVSFKTSVFLMAFQLAVLSATYAINHVHKGALYIV